MAGDQKKQREVAAADQRRGLTGKGGRWLSLREANEVVAKYGARDWWKIAVGGRSVHIPTNQARPVWMYEQTKKSKRGEELYLGEWSYSKDGRVLEHGFGVCFVNQLEAGKKGEIGLKVYVGEWKNGTPHGRGKEYWMYTKISPLKNLEFQYVGTFRVGLKKDDDAIVTLLLNEITRHGPWHNNKPVGNWWDHELFTLLGVFEGDAPQWRPTKISYSTDKNDKNANSSDSSHAEYDPVVHKRRKVIGSTQAIPDIANLGRAEHATTTDSNFSTSSPAIPPSGEEYKELVDWLSSSVFGGCPGVVLVTNYARELFRLGIDSQQTAVRDCWDEDIASWEWMLPVHKLAFHSWLANKRDGSVPV